MTARVLKGVVVSDKGDQTVVVCVSRRYMHPLYKKYVTKSKKFMAHDEGNTRKEGDTVNIQECRPYSKRKCWRVIADEKKA